MAPTAVRVIKKEDYEADLLKKYDVSSVKTFCLVGERCDPDTIYWIHNHLPNVLINDTWWQTETGWPISANLLNLKEFKTVFPTLPGSVTRPLPGYKVEIFDRDVFITDNYFIIKNWYWQKVRTFVSRPSSLT